MIHTELCDLLGIEYPVLQGGMAWIAESTLASAVTNAGGVGIIAGGSAPIDYLREQIRICKEKVGDKPFGVNIMLMHPQADEFAQIVVEEGVKVVTTGAGNPGKYIPQWKAAGIKVIPVVAAAVLAKHLEPLGIDAVIAEGTESGGHVGEMTTMALVPQVVDAVKVPVIAAGAQAAEGVFFQFHLVGTGLFLPDVLTAHPVFQHTHRCAHAAAGHDGIAVLGLEQGGFVVGVDGALLACQQAGAHLHAAGAQSQSCCQLTAIGDAACRNDRNADRVHDIA